MATDAGTGGRVARALLSVQDKTGLVEFARGLQDLGVELWTTAGTRRALDEAKVPSHPVEQLTGVDAWFDGRVKTLHPAVFGGVLAPRNPKGLAELHERGLRSFDLVVVNFYPFERHLAEAPDAPDREEFIDIGGVALARAAAKNHASVAVATDPAEYAPLLDELRNGRGALAPATRQALAVAAFARCSRYDAAISLGLAHRAGPSSPLPPDLRFGPDPLGLRYGENPHQAARAYRPVDPSTLGTTPVPLRLLKGEALSYTNLLDLEAATGLVEEFEEPSAAVVKHATPCGVASAPTIAGALGAAIATDPVARYGCVLAANRPLGSDDLGALHGVFVDLLVAPEFHPSSLEALGRRPKAKVLRASPPSLEGPRWEAKSALGRLLLQEADVRQLAPADWKHITGPELTADQRRSLEFAWRVVRHAKSNAIVLAHGTATVGIGSGQTSRVEAAELACEVAGERARGSVLASDAFFPFPDGVEAAGRAGVTAILQPGGSIRDPEVIETAKQYGISMYFTGWRVFRH